MRYWLRHLRWQLGRADEAKAAEVEQARILAASAHTKASWALLLAAACSLWKAVNILSKAVCSKLPEAI